MSDEERLNKELINDKSPEGKLKTLLVAMMSPVSTVRGYAALMQQWVESDKNVESLDSIKIWIDKIAQAGDDLKSLHDLIAGSLDTNEH